MSDTPWTPGPWVLVASDDYLIEAAHYPKDFPHHCKSDDLGPHIAIVGNRMPDFGEANARLIASAPELAEALEALVNAKSLSDVEGVVAGWNGTPDKSYKPHPYNLGARIKTCCGDYYKLEQAMKRARLALSKARGE